MNKITNIFPVIVLESQIVNHEIINQRLVKEIDTHFDNLQDKRVLSYKWRANIMTDKKHQMGYTSFMGPSLTTLSNFNFFHKHISDTIQDFFTQLNYYGGWNFANSWVSVYPKGAYIPLHDHRPVQWSGVYYVAAHENCGDIAFTDPKEYALQNEPRVHRF